MEDTTIVILTGLVTSGFTIILTRIFDFLKINREHKIHLEKHFFEKKLIYAEKTVEYLNEKANLFDNLGTVFSSFHPDSTSELIDKELFNSLDMIKEIFLDDLDMDEIFKIKIPSGMWLYFNVNQEDLPNKEFDKANVDLIKDFKKLENILATYTLPSEEEQERVKNLPSEEKTKWIVDFLKPMTELQIGFLKWATLLFNARNKLQKVSMSIEKEFKKYK